MSLRPVVLLTDPVSPQVQAELAGFADVRLAAAGQAEFARHLREAHAVVVRSPIPDAAFDAAPNMLLAVRHGAGVDMIPLANATANGVAVAAVTGANRAAVAEFAIAQIIAFSRRLPQAGRALHDQGWAAARNLATGRSEVGGKSVGIVGMGAVGSTLARICHHGFGMTVYGNRRRLTDMPDFVRPLSLPDLFATADFVVLACPLTEQTRGMVGKALLDAMRPEAVLVNVARGAIVQTAALVDALRSRRIAGAILDVFDPEPLPADSPLLALDTVLATPHCSGLSAESAVRLGLGALAEIRRVLAVTQHTETIHDT